MYFVCLGVCRIAYVFCLLLFMEDINVFCFVYVYGGYRRILFAFVYGGYRQVCLRLCRISMYFVFDISIEKRFHSSIHSKKGCYLYLQLDCNPPNVNSIPK